MLLENFIFPSTRINDSIHKLFVQFKLLLHSCLHQVTTPNFRFTHDQLHFLLFSGCILDLQELSYLLLEAMTGLTITIHQRNHLINTLLVRRELAIECRFCGATPIGELTMNLLLTLTLLCKQVVMLLRGKSAKLQQHCC